MTRPISRLFSRRVVLGTLAATALTPMLGGKARAASMEEIKKRGLIVATDIRGSREVVEDGVTGALVPARNAEALAGAIRTLLGDHEARGRLGEAGRRRAVERFDEDAVVERTLRVYERLLAARGMELPSAQRDGEQDVEHEMEHDAERDP